MNENLFRAFLLSRGGSEVDIAQQIEIIHRVEKILQEQVPTWTLEDINAASTQMLIDELIDRGENTIENFWGILRYANAIGNHDLYSTLHELLDGYEVMDNLHQQLGERVGEDLRDIIFEDLGLPPLGLSKREKARFTNRIMARLVTIFEEPYCREILSDSLRTLPDQYYPTAKSDYFVTCDGDLDRYLALRKEKFIETLKQHRENDQLFFGQKITDEVINFIKNQPEMGGGIRSGNVIFETKIPFNTLAYLEENDPMEKQYHYCHCPWARESLRRDTQRVPAVFCQCSAGFHKKPWEVIFGRKLQADVLESVLRGDERCRFAIYLPDEEVEILFTP